METDIYRANEIISELRAELDAAEVELLLTVEALVARVEQSTDQIQGRTAALVNRFKERKEPAYAERASELKGNAAALAADIREFINLDFESL